jgi:hypothetical protein
MKQGGKQRKKKKQAPLEVFLININIYMHSSLRPIQSAALLRTRTPCRTGDNPDPATTASNCNVPAITMTILDGQANSHGNSTR